jgi:hypothetical protein
MKSLLAAAITAVCCTVASAAEPVDEGLAEVDGFALIGEYHDQFQITSGGCRIVPCCP